MGVSLRNFEAFLRKLDITKPPYPCDHMPGRLYAEDGSLRGVVTASNEICLTDKESGNRMVFSPSLYQSSMHPDKKEIRTLTIEIDNGQCVLTTRYQVFRREPSGAVLSVREWIPKIPKADCRHCTNCGRCGW